MCLRLQEALAGSAASKRQPRMWGLPGFGKAVGARKAGLNVGLLMPVFVISRWKCAVWLLHINRLAYWAVF